ncbi:uncharacterized protein LOC127082005 [Lathyrus oleraceus]|uniref:uncharacterized protein LOC127082005 n=1 Tax=Pisum sativum TaxID=3888 RepID=UPI0021D3314A|nr:uncharacterized protein LOC127082005 [Pisum sativum]
MVVDSGKALKIKHRTLMLRKDDLKLIIEQIVDFESFRVNGFSLKASFEVQGWINYFKMLNGPTSPYLVKDLWVKDGVYDECSVALDNGKLKGKSRAEMGLEEFKEVEIRYVVMGVNVTITQSHISKLLNMDNTSRYALNTKDSSLESSVIKKPLFLKSEDFGKVKNTHIEYKLMFKILFECLILRE